MGHFPLPGAAEGWMQCLVGCAAWAKQGPAPLEGIRVRQAMVDIGMHKGVTSYLEVGKGRVWLVGMLEMFCHISVKGEKNFPQALILGLI